MLEQKYFDEFSLYHQKLAQVLRIKSVLEARKKTAIEKMMMATSYEMAIKVLASIGEIYKKEQKVVGICKKGLEKFVADLEAMDAMMQNSASFFGKLKGMVPFRSKADDLKISFLLKQWYGLLIKTTGVYYEMCDPILKNLKKQERSYANMVSAIKSKGFVSIREMEEFKEIEELHAQERQMLSVVQKDDHYAQIKAVIDSIGAELKKYPTLAWIQGFLVLVPISAFSVGVGASFGATYGSLLMVVGQIVCYFPVIFIASKLSYPLAVKQLEQFKESFSCILRSRQELAADFGSEINSEQLWR